MKKMWEEGGQRSSTAGELVVTLRGLTCNPECPSHISLSLDGFGTISLMSEASLEASASSVQGRWEGLIRNGGRQMCFLGLSQTLKSTIIVNH